MGGGVSGAVHDLTISKNDLLKRFPERIFIGDKAYTGNQNFVTPFKSPKTEGEEIWNSILGSLRVEVEHTFSRIKIFQCLNISWRHQIVFHPIVFHVITNLVNFDLIFYPTKK